MEWLRTWLTAITCAGLIAAMAVALTPAGPGRKLARFTGGLLVLMAVVGPIKELDLGDLAEALGKYRAGAASPAAEAMAAQNETMQKAIIEQETAAYISDKAKGLGLESVTVKVTCRVTEEGFPAPEEVYVSGRGDEEAWAALERAITADFAIDKSGQTLERMEGR